MSAAALTHNVDVLGLTKTLSRTQGKVERGEHELWESWAGKSEAKVLLFHTRR